MSERALSPAGLERYHIRRLLHGGKLDCGQVQARALNRHRYQRRIPAGAFVP